MSMELVGFVVGFMGGFVVGFMFFRTKFAPFGR